MTDERQTVAGAYQKIEGHEALCAERYLRINSALDKLEGSARQHERAAWGIVLALVAWMAVQLWNDHAHPIQPTAASPAVAK